MNFNNTLSVIISALILLDGIIGQFNCSLVGVNAVSHSGHNEMVLSRMAGIILCSWCNYVGGWGCGHGWAVIAARLWCVPPGPGVPSSKGTIDRERIFGDGNFY